jgi:hypothetical protein
VVEDGVTVAGGGVSEGKRAGAAAIAAGLLLLGAAPHHRTMPLPAPNPFRNRAHEAAAPSPPSPALRPTVSKPVAAPSPPAPPQNPPHADRANVPVTTEAACDGRLRRLGVQFVAKPPVKNGACAIAAPVEVTALGGGIAVAPPALLACTAAERLARWVAEAVAPAAQTAFGAKPVLIGQASAYVCRTRDRIAGAKISEHAFGDAVDVARIGLAGGKTVEIGRPAGDADRAFQAAIRRAACNYFTTVLGPGDAHHDSHLHLDRETRGSGFRLCE